MANQIPEEALAAIEDAVRRNPKGVSAPEILRALATSVPPRTLQYRLKHLVTRNRLVMDGEGRWARYRMSDAGAQGDVDERVIPLSEAGSAIRGYVRQAPEARKPVGYDRKFLDRYRPNVSFYLTEQDRTHLAAVGSPQIAEQPAGTYAKQILSRLLIDLSWNSSRLEGNTYSLLDTKRLIELGEEAVGRAHLEAQMILNHKDAIEFLVGAAAEIGFNRYTLLNLHALLANNLLADPAAPGRLRFIAVGIERSAFHPLEVPQLIEESFDQILATAAAISDPFEQAFFVMVQLPYLQPFDDVNKRVSRLAANIPLIKRNLTPLSFTDVPRQTYTEAVLGVYELNKIDPALGKFGGEGTFEAGTHGLLHFAVALNVPLGDSLAVRFAGNDYQTNGYVSPKGGRSTLQEGKIKLLYKPNGDLSVLVGLAMEEHHVNSGGIAQNLSAPYTFSNSSELISPGEDHFRQYWINANYNFGFANLTYIPAFRTWNENTGTVLSLLGQTVTLGVLVPTDNFLTQEIRLASNPGSPVTWLAGGYYYNNLLISNSINTNVTQGFIFAGADTKKSTKDYGLFEDATYPFADGWTATEGVRLDYTGVDTEQFYMALPNPFAPSGPTNPLTTATVSGKQGVGIFRNLTFRARIEKQLTPSNNLYAMVSTGFLPGDTQVYTQQNQTTGQTEAKVSTYAEERLTAYEIGSKNRFLSNRLQVNGDFFYYHYSGFQSSVTVSLEGIASGVTTVTPLRAYGPELELTYLLTPEDKVGLNYDYISAQYTNEPATFATYVANKDFPNVPKHALTVSYDHTLPLDNGSTLDFFADMRYTTGYLSANLSPAVVSGVPYTCPDSWQQCGAYDQIRAQVIGDAHVTWVSTNTKFSLTGYVRNLADNAYKTSGALNGTGAGFSASGTTYQPRLFGVVLNGKF